MNFKRHAVFLIICLTSLILFASTVTADQESLTEHPEQLLPPVLKAGWQRISVPEVGTIDIPPTMEVKSEKYKALTKTTDSKSFVIAQKGLNELRPEALKIYLRVMIDTEIYGPNEAETLYSRWSWTEQELEGISEATKLQMEREFSNASAQMPKNKSLKLVEFFPGTVEEINGMLALSYTYRRQLGNNPIVHCSMYAFQNYDRIHTLTMSYRESEREIWEKDFPAILSSFRVSELSHF